MVRKLEFGKAALLRDQISFLRGEEIIESSHLIE